MGYSELELLGRIIKFIFFCFLFLLFPFPPFFFFLCFSVRSGKAKIDILSQPFFLSAIQDPLQSNCYSIKSTPINIMYTI